MVHKGREHKRKERGNKYFNKDNAKVKIIMYIYSVGKANRNNMIHAPNAGLKSQEDVTLKNTLEKMIEDELVEKFLSTEVKNVIMYKLLPKGIEFAKFVEENLDKKLPIFSLEAFYEVKYLGKVIS